MSAGSGSSGLSDYASPPFSISSRPEKPTNRPVICIPINRFIHRVELAQVTSRFFFNVETDASCFSMGEGSSDSGRQEGPFSSTFFGSVAPGNSVSLLHSLRLRLVISSCRLSTAVLNNLEESSHSKKIYVPV